MPNTRASRVTIATMHPDNGSEAGVGTAVDCSAASAVIVFADAGGTPGVINIEYSVDGKEWKPLPLFSVDTGQPVSSTITENLIVFTEVFDDVWQMRANIPAPWVGGNPKVQAIVVR